MIDSKDLLLVSLSKFYSNEKFIETILPILKGESNVSLRLLDWYVTNYCKKNTINAKNDFNVYLSYRSQLKAYSKHNFDPFRRRERIMFYYQQEKCIETTIGQLNFFRWALKNDILDYVQNNIDNIEKDMFDTQKNMSEKDSKKRIELSCSKMKNMNMFEGSRTIQFN